MIELDLASATGLTGLVPEEVGQLVPEEVGQLVPEEVGQGLQG